MYFKPGLVIFARNRFSITMIYRCVRISYFFQFPTAVVSFFFFFVVINFIDLELFVIFFHAAGGEEFISPDFNYEILKSKNASVHHGRMR